MADKKTNINYYPVKIGNLKRNLPLFKVAPGVKIAIFNILGDTQIVKKAAQLLAKKLPNNADSIITDEVKRVTLAHELSSILKIPYIVLRKHVKPYMGSAVKEETLSITTGKTQEIWLDEKDKNLIKEKKVIIVDDVVSTGSTIKGMRNLVKKIGGDIVAQAAIFTEGEGWDDFIALGNLPVFKDK